MKAGRRRMILGVAGAAAMVCLFSGVWARGQATPAQTAPKPKAATGAPARQPRKRRRRSRADRGAQMAEVAFKDVTVLKGISVNEFMDTMGFFSASLSWNCTDCHGEDAVDDWANFANDTPRKTTARKMILDGEHPQQEQFRRLAPGDLLHLPSRRRPAQDHAEPGAAVQHAVRGSERSRRRAPGRRECPRRMQVLDKYFQAIGGADKVCGTEEPGRQGHLLGLRHG